MQVVYFMTFEDREHPGTRISEIDKSGMVDIIQTTPKLEKAVIFTPESDYELQPVDDVQPQFIAALYFDLLDDLESALAQAGHLQALAMPNRFPSLVGASITQQAMLSRLFPLPDPMMRSATKEKPWSYVVAYQGEAQDLNLWLMNYVNNHQSVVARLPGLRELEICTRIDWFGSLPWPRATCMLRSNVKFDSAAALKYALSSPVRLDVREDFKKFPPFSGGASHYPMSTLTVQSS